MCWCSYAWYCTHLPQAQLCAVCHLYLSFPIPAVLLTLSEALKLLNCYKLDWFDWVTQLTFYFLMARLPTSSEGSKIWYKTNQRTCGSAKANLRGPQVGHPLLKLLCPNQPHTCRRNNQQGPFILRTQETSTEQMDHVIKLRHEARHWV
jgi:hypothetical protein